MRFQFPSWWGYPSVRGAAAIAVVVALVAVSLAVTGAPQQGTSPADQVSAAAALSPSTLPTPIQHVFLIMMENYGTAQIVGSSNAPYQTSLADTYAWAGNNYYALCHPSTGNYIGLTSGQPLHCGSDGYSTYSVNNIGNELQTAGLPWIAYEESATKNCQTTNAGLYAVRHNPFPYYTDLGSPTDTNSACYTHVVPIANLTQDYPYNSTPPAFSFVAPNLDNDAHSSSAKVGDVFLQGFVSKLVSQTWFSNSVIFIAYDESGSPQLDTGYDGLAGGPVALFAVSPYSAGIGAVGTQDTSHYNLLSTIEWLLGLPPTGTGNDGTASFPAMKSLFNFGTVVTGSDTVTFTETGLPSGSSWSVTLNGTLESSLSSAISFSEPNGTYGYRVLSPTAADNGTRYLATPSTGSVDVSGANVTVPITYGPQYYLQVVASPTGDGTVSPTNGWYAAGHTVALRATPASGDSFSQWTGQGAGSYDGTSNPVTLTVRGPINESAEFAPSSGNLIPVTFTETGLPTGTPWNVSLNGQWEASSNATVGFRVANGSYGYAVGSPVPVAPNVEYVAQPSSGTVHLAGGSVDVPVSFAPQAFLVVTASGSGTVTMAPAADGWYLFGTRVEFNATAPFGSILVGWNGTGSGSYTGSANPVEVEVSGPIKEVAHFVVVTPAPPPPPAGGSPTGGAGESWGALIVPAVLLGAILGTVLTMNVAVRVSRRVQRHRARQ